MAYTERRLPHFSVTGVPIFVTFRLHGSLPRGRSFRPDILTSNGEAFAAMDRLLDNARSGSFALRRPEIARLVAGAIRAGDAVLQRYRLHAYAVMPNHVHMLATPSVPSPSWLGPLKGFTAHEANRILGTVGSRFWQDESYDHLVRQGEFERIKRYIEWNPVRAGIAANPEEFPWCSAAKNDAA
jgi:putative transposase